MGCKFTKDDPQSAGPTTNPMPVTMPDKIDYKARLERKLCLAKETPEPDYDLSDCSLKSIPNGVFIMCRVLRKETLNLSKNRLHSLDDGGQLTDLALLTALDISENRFVHLPNDISRLENLRILILSNNQLKRLPITINHLKCLELLDLSFNQINQIDELSCMPALRILNLSNNDRLTRLPYQLTTCSGLIDLIVTPDRMEYPPEAVVRLGTAAIIRYLTTEGVEFDVGEPDLQPIDISTSNVEDTTYLIETTSKRRESQVHHLPEIQDDELNTQLELELSNQQEKRKERLLEMLRRQQSEDDVLVNQLQQRKEVERTKLINQVIQAEESSNTVIDQLLTMRQIDPIPIEPSSEDYLLEQLHLKNIDLRKAEIVSAMTNLLESESNHIVQRQAEQVNQSKRLIEHEQKMNEQLMKAFRSHDQDRVVTTGRILENEELQKSAVTALIHRQDAQSWALVEQVRMVESQLANLTTIEIERRNLSVNETLTDLCDKRLELTNILLELMQQQDKRRNQLLDAIADMEEKRQSDEDNYWLLQYQKLSDSHPTRLTEQSMSMDPQLTLKFLANGVIHCLPFFIKFWTQQELGLISDSDLKEAGILNVNHRRGILRSINDYLDETQKTIPTAPEIENAEEATEIKLEPVNNLLETLAECVVCMEESCKIIFLPCGHLCCCLNCHGDLEICPMCRATIEQRIKVCQP